MTYKYIFLVGAPGSRWSSVNRNIYYSNSIDTTDFSEQRQYWHDWYNPKAPKLMHLGAYFDPGMEFGDFFDKLDQHSKEECEAEFDRPFTGGGVRIIKAHVFADHIDFIKKTWPECPIVLCYRDDDACLGWWVKCGHFNITYPLYHEYYKNLQTMGHIIDSQNLAIRRAIDIHAAKPVATNEELCKLMGISCPSEEFYQVYKQAGVEVFLV